MQEPASLRTRTGLFHNDAPSAYVAQNIQNKEANRILPRKIFHRKKLKGKQQSIFKPAMSTRGHGALPLLTTMPARFLHAPTPEADSPESGRCSPTYSHTEQGANPTSPAAYLAGGGATWPASADCRTLFTRCWVSPLEFGKIFPTVTDHPAINHYPLLFTRASTSSA